MENNDFRDVVEPSKIKRMQELLDESYAKGFADGKEEGLRAKPQGHWIPVSERLPERNKRVIVCYETMEGLKVDTSIFDKYGCLIGKAVAWMPLPKPYEP